MITKKPPSSAIYRVGQAAIKLANILTRFSTSHIPIRELPGVLTIRPPAPAPTPDPPSIDLAYEFAWRATKDLADALAAVGEDWAGWEPLLRADVSGLGEILAYVIDTFAWNGILASDVCPAPGANVPRIYFSVIDGLREVGEGLLEAAREQTGDLVPESGNVQTRECDAESVHEHPTQLHFGNWDLREAGLAKYKEQEFPIKGQMRRLLARFIRARGKPVHKDWLKAACKDPEIVDKSLTGALSRLRQHLRRHLPALIGTTDPIPYTDPGHYKLALQ
jgi:hypothetical protein